MPQIDIYNFFVTVATVFFWYIGTYLCICLDVGPVFLLNLKFNCVPPVLCKLIYFLLFYR